MNNKRIFLYWLGLISTQLGYSQALSFNTMGASGASFQSATHQIDYTLGEAITSSFSSGNHMITQGYQQPMRTRATISLGEPVYLDIPENVSNQVNVYPNPFQSEITIETGTDESMRLFVYDLSGKLVYQELIAAEVAKLNLSELPVGNYRLSLWNTQGINYEFSLVKIY